MASTRTTAYELLADIERVFQRFTTHGQTELWLLYRGGLSLRYEAEALNPARPHPDSRAWITLPRNALSKSSIPVIHAMVARDVPSKAHPVLEQHLRKVLGKVHYHDAARRRHEIAQIRRVATPYTQINVFEPMFRQRLPSAPGNARTPYKTLLMIMHRSLVETFSEALTHRAQVRLADLLQPTECRLMLRVHVSDLDEFTGLNVLMAPLVDLAHMALMEHYCSLAKQTQIILDNKTWLTVEQLFFLARVQLVVEEEGGVMRVLRPREKDAIEEAQTIPTWVHFEFTICPRNKCPEWAPCRANSLYEHDTLWHIDLDDLKRLKEDDEARADLVSKALLKTSYMTQMLAKEEAQAAADAAKK